MVELKNMTYVNVDFLVCCLNDRDVTRYLSSRIPYPYTYEDAEWWIEVGSQHEGVAKAVMFDEQFCGVVGIDWQNSNEPGSAELGYWLAKMYWGRGIASAAVTQFTDFIFSTTSIRRIFNPVSAPNTASIRVMEKAGYTLERVLQNSIQKGGQHCDELLFAKYADG